MHKGSHAEQDWVTDTTEHKDIHLQLCDSNMVATVCGRITHGCDDQVSTYFWPYSICGLKFIL